jgi:3-oxoadipate enol-lactonase
VLANTTAWYGPDAPSTWAQRAQRAESVPRADQLPFQLDRWFSPGFRSTHPGEVSRVADIFLSTRSDAHAAAATAMGQLDARPLLPAITAPTLVLVGEQDYATPPAMATALARAIPNAGLRVLPELRHLSLIEQPDLIEPVRQHLRAAAGSTSEVQ